MEASDIKFWKSAVMSNDAEGGGRISGNQVLDGVENSVFNDISTLQTEVGGSETRKIYWSVGTDDAEELLGVNVILAGDSPDENISAFIYTDNSWSSTKESYIAELENYFSRGPIYYGYLFDNHYEGSLFLQILQRTDLNIPSIGETLVISENEGEDDEIEQFVRVANLDKEIRSFYDPGSQKDYQKAVVTLTLTKQLDYSFDGGQPVKDDMDKSALSKLRETRAGQSIEVYGVQPLTEQAEIGALSVRVPSIFTRVIPVGQGEQTLSGISAVPKKQIFVQSGDDDSIDFYCTSNTIYCFVPLTPGKVKLIGSETLTDNARGELSGINVSGSVDYATGIITISSSQNWHVVATPAVATTGIMESVTIPVTLESRVQTVIKTIPFKPALGSVEIHYRVLEKWYVLRDYGDGIIRNYDYAPKGTVNRTTNAINATLEALPDVDSTIIIYAAPDGIYSAAGDISVSDLEIPFTLHAGTKPGEVVATWDGGAKTATDDGNGVFTGDATGTINYVSGVGVLRPFVRPILPGNVSFAYKYANVTTTVLNVNPSGNQISFTIPNAPLAEKMQQILWNVTRVQNGKNYILQKSITDRGNGRWSNETQAPYIGSVNYNTGESVILFSDEYISHYVHYDAVTGGRVLSSISGNEGFYGNTITIKYVPSGEAYVDATKEVQITLKVSLSNIGNEDSVLLPIALKSDSYSIIVNTDNNVYSSLNNANGSKTQIGTFDKASNIITFTSIPGSNISFDIVGLISQTVIDAIGKIVGRTSGTPISQGSYQIIGESQSGITVIGDSDENGDISGNEQGIEITGTINIINGVFIAEFKDINGDYVPMSPNEITYNAIVVTKTSLPENIAGLKLERLPPDGLLPIFTKDRLCVVHHTGSITLDSPLSPNAEYNAGRARLTRCRVVDSDGKVVPSTQYSVDLDTGVLTTAAVLNLDGFIQPLKWQHTIEQGSQIRDVDPSGVIFLNSQLSYVFPIGSKVSSALMLGTRRVRFDSFHAGKIWQGIWSNQLEGQGITAQPNWSIYPPILTNRGTITERWVIIFLSGGSEFEVYGEYSGKIGNGLTTEDYAPINPYWGGYYFAIKKEIWGAGGFAASNFVRFNTYGIGGPLIVGRVIQPGTDPSAFDEIDLWIRSNVNQ